MLCKPEREFLGICSMDDGPALALDVSLPETDISDPMPDLLTRH
jgi:hypothetical protein